MDREAIKQYRINALLTQKKLGELLGYTGRYAELMVQRWEYGITQVPLKLLRPLHDLIGIPYDKIVP